VSRLTEQKMGDELAIIARRILMQEENSQFIFAGRGDQKIEEQLLALSVEFPDRVACAFEVNEQLFHEVYAGADIIVHGSRWEPCGLSHRYAMLFGTVPVVTYIDGLIDSVCDPEIDGTQEAQNGFLRAK